MAVTFVVLYVGVRELQPAYNRQFALRGDLRKQVALLDQRPACVVCYPQRWDSVSFYLPQANIKVYHTDERARLLSDLRLQPETLLLVRSGHALRELLDGLPPSVEFIARNRQGPITVGLVRSHDAVPITAFAKLASRTP